MKNRILPVSDVQDRSPAFNPPRIIRLDHPSDLTQEFLRIADKHGIIESAMDQMSGPELMSFAEMSPEEQLEKICTDGRRAEENGWEDYDGD